LSKLPWRTQLAVFVLLAVGAVGAFYYFYEMPQQVELDAKRQALATVMTRVNKARETARQLTEFRKEVDTLRARLESLKPILPEEKDAGDLLRRVQNLAVQSNLTIRGFRPQATNLKDLHAEWPIALELEGTYHNLGQFLDSVSKFPRIINVGALDIRAKAQPEPDKLIDIKCTATTFVLLDESTMPTKKGAASKSAPTKTE
jgi:type IV pilus assembly protein PilO